jgi:hypothetical protein
MLFFLEHKIACAGKLGDEYSFAKSPLRAANAPDAIARIIQRGFAAGACVGSGIFEVYFISYGLEKIWRCTWVGQEVESWG